MRRSLLSDRRNLQGLQITRRWHMTRCSIAPERTVPLRQAVSESDKYSNSDLVSDLVVSEPVPDITGWRYVGAPLSQGALPAIVYFALTASQSLELDPFNQFPAEILARCDGKVRVFSATLPLHSDDMAANEAVFHAWAEVYQAGGDIVSGFVRRADDAVRQLVTNNYASAERVYVAGLSRGGLFAALLAARNEHIRSCLAFAPVTVLAQLPELAPSTITNPRATEKIARASLLQSDVIDALVDVSVRIYMGNSDTRVGTRNAFDFAHAVAERAAESGVRSPPHEFIMYCRYATIAFRSTIWYRNTRPKWPFSFCNPNSRLFVLCSMR